jgi:hypothetical protein
MTPLSPAAQAVWDAWNDAYEAQGPLEDMGQPIAAALRAVACQIKPHISRTPWLTNDDGYFNETFENLEALGELNSVFKLLDIAAELGGTNNISRED